MNKYFACKVAAVDPIMNEDLQSRIPLSKIVLVILKKLFALIFCGWIYLPWLYSTIYYCQCSWRMCRTEWTKRRSGWWNSKKNELKLGRTCLVIYLLLQPIKKPMWLNRYWHQAPAKLWCHRLDRRATPGSLPADRWVSINNGSYTLHGTGNGTGTCPCTVQCVWAIITARNEVGAR